METYVFHRPEGSPVKLDVYNDHYGLGPKDDQGYLWMFQDGMIFSWSESNVQYEIAWWLNRDGTVDYSSTPNTDLLQAIIAERPFDPEWLQI